MVYQFYMTGSQTTIAETGALPVYMQIAELLSRQIDAGILVEGQRLPPEREMAKQHGVAVGTLRKSLARLTAMGRLARRQGSGNYILRSDEMAAIYAMFRLELPTGGMVAITSVLEGFPRPLFTAMSLILLLLSLAVLVVGFQLGWKHVNSGWLFSSSSLKLPLSLIGMKSVKIKLAWMYMSLFTGVCLMIMVNVELIVRSLVAACGGAERLRPIPAEGGGVPSGDGAA